MTIYSVKLPEEAKPYFKVALTSSCITIPNNTSKDAIKIKFTPSKHLTHLTTQLRINTNLSYFDVPLIAYSGKLQLVITNRNYKNLLFSNLVFFFSLFQIPSIKLYLTLVQLV